MLEGGRAPESFLTPPRRPKPPVRFFEAPSCPPCCVLPGAQLPPPTSLGSFLRKPSTRSALSVLPASSTCYVLFSRSRKC